MDEREPCAIELLRELKRSKKDVSRLQYEKEQILQTIIEMLVCAVRKAGTSSRYIEWLL